MYDPETGEKVPLAPVVLLRVEGHDMTIGEIPKDVNGLRWKEYLPICDCGWYRRPGKGWYFTKRGATIAANKHLEEVSV